MNFLEINRHGRLLVLVSICIALYGAIDSRAILVFLHPRSLPLVKFAWLLFIALTLNEVKTFTRCKGSQKPDWRLFALMLPIVVVLLVNPTGLSSRIAVQKGLSSLSITSGQNGNRFGPADTPEKNTNLLVLQTPETRSSDTIADGSLYEYLDKLYADPAHYLGKRYTMTGFVSPDTLLGKNSFFLTRMMITCCAADASPVGFYCTIDSKSGIQENDWVIVTGVLKPRVIKFPWDNQSRTIPLLTVIAVKKTTKPQNEYVYQVAY